MSSIPNWSPPPGGSNYYNGFPQQMCFDENYLYFPNLSPNCISQTKLSDGSINNYYYFDSSNNPDFQSGIFSVDSNIFRYFIYYILYLYYGYETQMYKVN